MCANTATPPADPKTAFSTCPPNQNAMKRPAGSRRNQIGRTNVRIRCRGNSTRYAASTPAMAPDAPTMGVSTSPETADANVCDSAAATPDSR